jgi:CRP-like cAMP-binding protein
MKPPERDNSVPSRPEQNRLLAVLSVDDFARVQPHLEAVRLPLGGMLYEPGKKLRHAYFPTTAVVSLHYVTESGASAEVAGVGNDGVVGISLFMGGDTTPSSAVVQSEGFAYRLERAVLLREFERSADFRDLLLRYAQGLITQVTQLGACNRHHSIEQQLCRWLLATLDRTPPGDLILTQELVATILGVRRESVTEVAGKLQRLGLISYRRGHISVLGRAGLELLACECYEVVRRELRRLLPDEPVLHDTASGDLAPGRPQREATKD